MADAIVNLVAERAATIIAEQISKEVNLVRGVKKRLQNLSDELKTIRSVLDDAERQGYKNKSVKDWLRRLEHTSYEMDDVLDEWDVANINLEMEQSNAINVVGPKNKVRSCIPSSSCLCFKKVAIHRDIAKKIEKVKANLDQILAEKDRYGFLTSQSTDHSGESWRVQSTSLINLGEVYGRKIEREDLVEKLVSEEGGNGGEHSGVRVFSVVGVGGLGKTTLAQLAYNDSRVEKYFDIRIWICVSDPFDEVEIAKGILRIVTKEDSISTNQLEILLRRIEEAISGKKFLLVMDDVWEEDNTKWEPLKNALRCGGAGSKVLLTTRNERVAIMMGSVGNKIQNLEHLSDEDCWLLLSRIALSGKNKEEGEEFQNIGKNIANKCKGLPLAAKTLGSLLRFKRTLEEWENILNSEIWELEEVEVELFPHLLLSYNELSPQLKRCFSYCAVFPKDTRIDVEKLITEWMALGYLGSSSRANDWELRGREYFDKLAMRSLFQDFQSHFDEQTPIKSFKMHDILHDFARFLRKDAQEVGAAGTKETSSDPLLVSHAKEFRSLFCDKEPPLDVYDFVKNLRLLSLRKCRWPSVPKKLEKLIHLRWLDLGWSQCGARDLKPVFRLYNLQFLWLNNCGLAEIPQEIGNLIHLIYLDLSGNTHLKLSESLCNLRELESLNVDSCNNLYGLPQGIQSLIKLKHLSNIGTSSLKQYPGGLAQLTSLCTLPEFFHGKGTGWESKLGWLKNLNQLTGNLFLRIELKKEDKAESVVEDAREAELRNKTHIQTLKIVFEWNNSRDSVWRDVIEALEPHQNLQNLKIQNYEGSQFAGWIASPVNRLRSIQLADCRHMSTMPPLGKLPFLEEIYMSEIDGLQFLGREFLGVDINSSSSGIINTSVVIGFPKLKILEFSELRGWKEWEDITAEEEDSPLVSFMPCLKQLSIIVCPGLTKLPHRLLRKASSLGTLNICMSPQLQAIYRNKEGEAWKSISRHNPHIKLSSHIFFLTKKI